MTVSEGTCVNDMFSVFKNAVVAVQAQVVGYTVHKDRKMGNSGGQVR